MIKKRFRVHGLGFKVKANGSKLKAEGSKVDRPASKLSSIPAFQPMSYKLI